MEDEWTATIKDSEIKFQTVRTEQGIKIVWTIGNSTTEYQTGDKELSRQVVEDFYYRFSQFIEP